MAYKVGEIGQRPWGHWRIDNVGEGFVNKTIVVNCGASLSLQSHMHRSEEWKIVAGTAEVTVDGRLLILQAHETVMIPVQATHRLRNVGNILLIVEEIQWGEILNEEDIVRYEDVYGRCGEKRSSVNQSTVFLADMDGTLTPARLPMTKNFAVYFEKFIANKLFYIVSGSDYGKILEQLPANIVEKITGIYASMGNEFYEKGKLIYKNEFVPEESLLEKLEYYRRVTKYPFELYPNYLEKRCGMVNFSVLGRNCSHEERVRYNKWDKKNGEREEIARELSAAYPKYDISLGGEISIDIVPYGSGKDQVANRLRAIYKREKIVFFGDRTENGGNDYSIAQRLLALGNAEVVPVCGSEDVLRILREKYE
ncbi:MAG: HAD-IIB family hydrolase [Holosporaceae bacterium]|nr:HAD-IIB family hydrolase [Holosporaceae bacterium]